MSLLNKITGNDMTKELKDFERRVLKLPDEYQKAWEEIGQNLWQYSDFTGRNIMSILESVLTMLEETSVNGQKIEDVFGDDINEFCLELVGEEKGDNYRDKWRKQLNRTIEKKLARRKVK